MVKRRLKKRVSGETARTREIVRRLARAPDPILGLHQIAHLLNGLPTLATETARVWQKVEKIVSLSVTKPSSILAEWLSQPAAAVREFNRLAEEAKMPLRVEQSWRDKGFVMTTSIAPADQLGTAVWFLWKFFFQGRGWQRLKRCRQCGEWFVDETRNKTRLGCSDECTWKWWSRSRRKKNGHKATKKP